MLLTGETIYVPAGAASVPFKMGTKLAPEANTALWNLKLFAALALAHAGLRPSTFAISLISPHGPPVLQPKLTALPLAAAEPFDMIPGDGAQVPYVCKVNTPESFP